MHRRVSLRRHDQGRHPEPGEDFHKEAVHGYSIPKAEDLAHEIHKRFLLPPLSLPSAGLWLFAGGTQKCVNIKIGTRVIIIPWAMLGDIQSRERCESSRLRLVVRQACGVGSLCENQYCDQKGRTFGQAHAQRVCRASVLAPALRKTGATNQILPMFKFKGSPAFVTMRAAKSSSKSPDLILGGLSPLLLSDCQPDLRRMAEILATSSRGLNGLVK